MYWILVSKAAIAAAVVALVVGGMVSPREYRVGRRLTLPVAPTVVYALLDDIVRYDDWVGAPLSLVREDGAAPGQIALQVVDDDTGVQRGWVWDVVGSAHETSPPSTLISLHERGRIENPVVRFFAALLGHAGGTERTLQRLATHLGHAGATIEPCT
jgi:hypothetical protein